MPLPAAAAIGAGALKWLPAIGAVGGALPGLRKGNLGEAALGSGMGALTGYGTIGGLGGLTKAGMRLAGSKGAVGSATNLLGRVAPNLVDAPLKSMMVSGARAGIPVLGAAGVYGVSGGLSGLGTKAGGGALGAGASQLAKEGNLVPMSSLPQGFRPNDNQMVQGPQGNWWYQMDPSGVAQGNRMGRLLDAQVNASNLNTLGNALFGQTERIGQAEFARQAAGAQLLSNINQARQMALASQEAGLRMGMNAGQNMAEAMQNRQNFRYF